MDGRRGPLVMVVQELREVLTQDFVTPTHTTGRDRKFKQALLILASELCPTGNNRIAKGKRKSVISLPSLPQAIDRLANDGGSKNLGLRRIVDRPIASG